MNMYHAKLRSFWGGKKRKSIHILGRSNHLCEKIEFSSDNRGESRVLESELRLRETSNNF